MGNIQLLEGLFHDSQQKGKDYLLYLDVDRLVAPCYEAVGVEAKKERYGGWESTPIAGHSIGHWLSASATMYSVTGDTTLKEKLEYALSELESIQSIDHDGYLSGFPRDCFDQVFTGNFEVSNFSLGGSWVPWYSIHKIYAGLIDVYQIIGSEKALEIVIRLSDWAYKGLKDLTEEQFQEMLRCEHGGMNEVFADLYLITEDKRYLELAEKFYHNAVLDPLANKHDDLEGKHANTQIPKVIGVAKLYNITGKEKYKQIATYFWDQVVHYRTYAIGGNSIREHFGPENAEELGILTTETCNTYNMLKLTELLFDWQPHSYYFDYYERALYNHILASQDPDSGMKTYFVSTEPGHFKVYHSHDHSFWCCTGTGMENPARYNRRIVEMKEDTLYVHLFISAKASFFDNRIKIKQLTDFPYQHSSALILEKVSDDLREIRIRKPNWLKNNSQVSVNGKPQNVEIENGYLVLKHDWQKGDEISFDLSMELFRYYAKDDDKKQVIMYGPLVLAGALGRENFPNTDILADHQSLNNHPLIEVPTLVTEEDLSNWIMLKDKEQLIFETNAIGQPGNQQVTLKPFFNIHHERYTIYWNIMSETRYQQVGDEEKKRRAREQNVIIDEVTPHEQQPEVDHQLKEVNSFSGYSNDVHSGWRDARNGGYFSYVMKVKSNHPMYLYVTYNKSDATIDVDGIKLEREFTISVDDHILAKEHFNQPNIGELYSKSYRIPTQLIEGKEKVTVKFSADERKIAGGVYHLRVLNEPNL
ncbi:glycoside hydrolase family 127 protein [Gracilibacillus massiliensis]|uniref:glycoside hydrolase family 127 protein n=1 Tax=Gracilibacillus massiliensis TaxID=1564956 RepID=UPI00071C4E8F|nr:glycoside hydrolase family 127 protein [Gracilibacillus massiliensis]